GRTSRSRLREPAGRAPPRRPTNARRASGAAGLPAGAAPMPATRRQSELPLPAERIAVHRVDALLRQVVADRVGRGEILLRAGGLAAGKRLLDLGFGDNGVSR